MLSLKLPEQQSPQLSPFQYNFISRIHGKRLFLNVTSSSSPSQKSLSAVYDQRENTKNFEYTHKSLNSDNLSTAGKDSGSFETLGQTQSSEKKFDFAKLVIDFDNDQETRIHDWLDKENVVVTDPYDKVADYYHSIRLSMFNFTNEAAKTVRQMNGPKNQSQFNQQRGSDLSMNSSPIFQRRKKAFEETKDISSQMSIFKEERSFEEIQHA